MDLSNCKNNDHAWMSIAQHTDSYDIKTITEWCSICGAVKKIEGNDNRYRDKTGIVYPELTRRLIKDSF